MPEIRVIKRNACRICGGADLRRWVHLPQMPLTDDMRRPGSSTREFLNDIDVYLCSSCRTSQILHDIDLQDYYLDYNYTVAGSPFALAFMSKLAATLFERFDLRPGCAVVEIGSGDGAQLLQFQKLGARVFGYEPSSVLCATSESIGVPVHMGLFDEHSIASIPVDFRPADVLLLTYTFDHIPEPMRFLETARRMLNPERGLLVMEVHDLDKIMARREYCLFEHEHSIYLSAATMQRVLKRAGFELLSIDLLPEAERRGNSLLVVAACSGSDYHDRALPPLADASDEGLSGYLSFGGEMVEGIQRLDRFVESHRAAGRRVAGYGAGGRGVMTLAAMESASGLAYLCDRNPAFHGFLTPKARVPIVAPEMLAEDPVDVLLVFSFGYMQEIRELVTSLPNAPREIISMLEIL